jgi:hypothetical protein
MIARCGTFATLMVSSIALANEWSGTMSCRELQNVRNPVTQKPFTSAITLTIDHGHAVLERHWNTGREQAGGAVQRNGSLELNGLEWFFNNAAGYWRTRASLVKREAAYSGAAVIEKRPHFAAVKSGKW